MNAMQSGKQYRLEQIEANKLSKQRGYAPNGNNCDLMITVAKDSKAKSGWRTCFYFYHPVFMKYKYVIFYCVEDILYMRLVNENPDGSAYTLTKRQLKSTDRKSYVHTQISGDNGEVIKAFEGQHIMFQYNWKNSDKPMFFINKQGTESIG